ncbi:hypothetical protein [Planktothricoides raciborskii]|uniref:DUF4384 domain-containing protein n=1 Tax=Planktothricoides raciborskii GIHE-MW2 TaxID=2792601 RepID=A0AAU8JDF2_9CYAN
MQGAKEFLEEIKQELIERKNLGLIESVFFPLRFAKDRRLDYQHKKIAIEDMPKDPRLCKDGQYANSIGTNVQNIVHAMADLYRQEMQDDGLDPESLKNRKRGEKGAWLDIHDWLWNYKFKRWLEKNAWSILKEKAKNSDNWLQFLTNEDMASLKRGDRGLMMPPPPASVQQTQPTIPINQSLWMVIDLELQPETNYQLLLLNRSQDGESLLCPSSAFAPNALIDKPPILLPQKDSWAAQAENPINFKFGKLETEEFLAIVLNQSLDLPWLTPRQEELLPEWTGERIKELFEKLEQQDNWQVFYQSFDVVERA